MAVTQSIDLLPKATVEEVQEESRRGRVNLSGVFFVFIVVFFSITILGANLLVRLDLNNRKQELADAESEIMKLRYVELKQKTLNNKVSTFGSVQRRDFNSDKVLNYLMDIAQDISTVESLELDDDMRFEISGHTTSYANVARLWHDMSREEEYFESINLEFARRQAIEEGNRVNFSFSGVMIKENVDNL